MTNRTEIAKKIVSSLDEISRIQNALYALHMTDIGRYPENYETLSMDIALRAEGITCGLRNLVYDTTAVKKVEYLEKAASEHHIAIENKEGVIQITLPALLPKKKQQQNKFLLDPLYYAFDDYIKTHGNSIFTECVVYIVSVYTEEANRKFIDYDNIETKQLIDAIAAYFLVDDSGKFIDVHNTTETGETECTQVFLVDKMLFPKWLEQRSNTV